MVNIKNNATETLVSANEIPIIDLASLNLDTSPSKQWLDNIARQVKEAFSKRGIFFLVNHGIAEEKFRSANKIMEQFCALPDNVKEKYKITSPDDPQGYIPVGQESLDPEKRMEIRHCFNLQSFSKRIPSKELPIFEEEIGALADNFYKLTTIMLQAIALSLDADPEVFLGLHKGMLKKDNITTLRMLYYPPIDEELPRDAAIRCGEHKDWGTIVMLNQDIDGGLEVFLDGKWKRVGHLPGAILVNIGEVLEKWSDSQYRAVLHRVVIPEEPELRSKGRHSMGFFVLADNKTLVHRSALTTSETSEKSVTKENVPTADTVFHFLLNKLTAAYTKSNEI